MMKKIENCLEELRLNDVKSTKLVVRSFWFSLVVVFVSGLFLEVIRGLGYTFEVVLNEYLDKAFKLLFDKFL
jgi:hypothetical protein